MWDARNARLQLQNLPLQFLLYFVSTPFDGFGWWICELDLMGSGWWRVLERGSVQASAL